MTIRIRNQILGLALVFALMVGAYVSYLSLSSVSRGFAWLFSPSLMALGIRTTVPLIITIVGLIGFFRYFRKVTGSLIFYFFLFLTSMVFEAVPLVGYYWQQIDIPFHWMLLLTRLHIFGILLGTLAMFVASIYTSGVTYKHQGTALIIILGLAYAIAQLVPINTSELGLGGIMKVGGLKTLAALKGVTIFLILLNFIYSWRIHQNKDDLIIGFAVLFILLGRWALHSLHSIPALILASVLLITGSLYYGKKVFHLYLWY